MISATSSPDTLAFAVTYWGLVFSSVLAMLYSTASTLAEAEEIEALFFPSSMSLN